MIVRSVIARFIVWIALGLLVLQPGTGLCAEPSSAAEQRPGIGLAVEPGGLLIQEVAPGESYDLKAKSGIGLTIFNQDGRAHTYSLSTHRPSEVANRRVPPGYCDIVDPSWLWFEKKEVVVPAQGSAEVGMYLEIPDNERYWNQHWSISVGVVGKPGPGDRLALAAYPRFEIETASRPRAELRLRPAGEIGLCPSKVVFTDLKAGERRESGFILCNNVKRTHRYRFTILRQGEIAEGRRIFQSSGHTWLPDPQAVRVRYGRAWVRGRRFVTMPLRVKLPQEAEVPEGGWEAIVFVERDDGASGFVRVLVERGQTSEAGATG